MRLDLWKSSVYGKERGEKNKHVINSKVRVWLNEDGQRRSKRKEV